MIISKFVKKRALRSVFIDEKYLKRNIIKIISTANSGTGVILKTGDGFTLIATCHHVLRGDERAKLYFYNSGEYRVIDLSEYRVEINDCKDEDLCIIKIHDLSLSIFECLSVKPNDTFANISVYGYPSNADPQYNTKDNHNYDCVVVSRINGEKAYLESQIHSCSAGSTEIVKGFSGAPLFYNVGAHYYLIGIVSEFIEGMNYFKFISITKYLEVIKDNLGVSFCVFTDNICHLPELIKKSKNYSNSIRTTLGDSIYIDRQEKVDEVLNSEKTIRVLKGAQGTGKSVLLKKVIENDKYLFPIMVRGDNLELNYEELIGTLNSPCDDLSEKICVIVDSCEKVFEVGTEHLLEDIINMASKNSVTVILGIRSYSYDYLIRTITLTCNIFDYESIEIDKFNNNEFEIIKNHLPQINSLSNNLKKLLRVPFYLRCFVDYFDKDNFSCVKNIYEFNKLIWDLITCEKINKKKTLFNILQQKSDNRSEYVSVDDSENVIESLISEGVLNTKDTLVSYSHDIFEDITGEMYLDNVYTLNHEDICQTLQSVNNNMVYSRIFKLWIGARIASNDVEIISRWEQEICSSSDLDYIWHWNIREAIYTSAQFVDYLNYNKDRIKEDNQFIRNIYNICKTTQLIDIAPNQPYEDYYFHFNHFSIPSLKSVTFLRFLNDNFEDISDEDKQFIIQLISANAKLVLVFINHNTNFLECILELIDKIYLFTHKDKYYSEDLIYKLVYSIGMYSIIFPSLVEKYFKPIKAVHHTLAKLINVIFFPGHESIYLTYEFYMEQYNIVIQLFKNQIFNTIEDKGPYYSSFNDCDYYGIRDYEYSVSGVVPSSTMFQVLLDINLKNTSEVIIEFVNKCCDNYYTNRKNATEFPYVTNIPFIYEDESRLLIHNSGFYGKHRCYNVQTKLINSILCAFEIALLESGDKDTVKDIVNSIVNNTNNTMLLAVAMSITNSNINEYGDMFLKCAENMFIRSFEISIYTANVGPRICSPKYREEFNKIDDYKHRKNTYDNNFINLQLLSKWKEQTFEFIDTKKKELKDKTGHEYIVYKSFLHNCDIRNFQVEQETEEGLIVVAKENDDIKVRDAIKNLNMENDLTSNLMNSCIVIQEKLYEDEKYDIENYIAFVKDYMNGKYNAFQSPLYLEYIWLFALENNRSFKSNEVKRAKKELLMLVEVNDSDRTNFDYRYAIRILNNIKYLEDNLSNRKLKKVLYFIFKLLSRSSHIDILELYKLAENFKEEQKRNVKRIINALLYCLSDTQEKDIIGENKFITIKNSRQLHEVMLKRIKKNILKTNKTIQNLRIDESRHFIIRIIIGLGSCLSFDFNKQFIMKLLEIYKEGKNETQGRYNVDYIHIEKFAISYELCNRVQKFENIDDIFNILLDDYTIYFEFIIDFIDNLNAYCQDKYVASTKAWKYITKLFSVLQSDNDLNNIFADCENRRYYNNNENVIGKIVRTAMLVDSNWIYTSNPNAIQLIDDNLEQYLNMLDSIICSSVGIYILFRLLFRFDDMVDIKTIFRYKDAILKNATNDWYFEERNVDSYIERFFEKVYINIEDFTREEKDYLQQLLVAIGYNMPSPFLLHLKQKLEY